MSNLVFFLDQRTFALNLVRTVLTWFDMVIFGAFELLIQAIFDMSTTSVLSDSVFDDFAQRIYVILGIFMLFKVVVTLLGYLVNPDKITDKSEGLSKIIVRILTSICMLAGLPFLWNLMFGKEVINGKSLTEILLEAVPRFFIGTNATIDDTSSNAQSASKNISWSIYKVFFTNADGSEVDCEGGVCNIEWAHDSVNDPSPNSNAEYMYKHTIVIPFVVGVILVWIIAGIAIDVAIRTFKLIILRMIAPVPIISYVLPKSAKDGGTFKNWVSALFSTWIDLFIKIGIVYFVLYMLNIVCANGFDLNIGGSGIDSFVRKGVVIIFLIIGLLLFAKQAPKFITDLLGIKNPKGSLGLSGMAAAGAGLLTGAGIGGALAAGANQLMTGATNQAEGKAVGSGWSKGREIATQLKAGNKDAKPLSMMDRMNNAAMRRSLAKKGITKSSIADAETNIQQLKDNLSASQTRLSDMQSLNSAYSTRTSLDTQIENLSNSRDAIVGNDAEQQQQRALINTQIAQLEAQKASNDAQISRLESNPSYAGVSEGNIESRINNLQTEIGNRQEVIADAQEKYSDSKSKYKAATGKYNGKPTSEFKVGIHDGVSTGKINQTDKTKN